MRPRPGVTVQDIVQVDLLEGTAFKATVVSGIEFRGPGELVSYGADHTRFESGVPISGLQPLSIRVARDTTSSNPGTVRVTVAGYMW